MIAIIEPGSAYPTTLQLVTKMSIDTYHWVREQQQSSKPRKKEKKESKAKQTRRQARNSGRCIKSCTQRDRRDTESRAEERAERQRQRECREHCKYTSEALQDGMLGTSASDSHPQVYPCESSREVTMRLQLLLITSCSRNATGHCSRFRSPQSLAQGTQSSSRRLRSSCCIQRRSSSSSSSSCGCCLMHPI